MTVQGRVSLLFSSSTSQQIQIEVNGAGPLYELNPGDGYADCADIIKGAFFAQIELLVVYGTANPDGSFPILQVAALA